MSAPSSMLECALELARRGWPVFPCEARGKRPLCPHGFKDATTDEAALRNWWTRWPDANVGLATGSPSGLIVVDVDPRNGGLESLASLPEWKAHIEQTLCVRTGGGGFHAYFSCEKGATLKLPAKLAAGIDLKSEGGYVIAPGSIHASGKPYQWGFEANEPIGTQEILALPFELLEPAPSPPPARSLRPVDPSGAPNAAARYNAEHAQDWPARPGTCPICNHNGCFKALKGSTDRWICYSTNHPDDAGQRNGNGQAWGDALDIDAYNGGFRGQRGRIKYLRSLGFLESACEKEPRFDSQDPVPDEVLSALAPSRDDDQSFVCDNPNVATAATIEPPQFDEPPDDVLAARAADECAAAAATCNPHYAPMPSPASSRALDVPKQPTTAKESPSAPKTDPDVPPQTPGAEPITSSSWSDSGNAKLFAEIQEGQLLYVRDMERWLLWDERRWTRATDADLTGRAICVAEVRLKSAKDLRVIPDDKASQKRRDDALAFAKKCESSARRKAILDLAIGEPQLAATSAELDQHPWLLSCANGVIDLRDGTLGPHDRALKLTKATSVSYDERAKCPTWLRFLDDVFLSDGDLIGFVQRAIGYTLTGQTSEQKFFVCYESGSNGKSTFLNVLRDLLGDYAGSIQFDTLAGGKRDPGAPAPDLAKLRGLRLVTSLEAEEGARFGEALVKQLTGSDPISARDLHESPVTFVPTFKLWLAANHKPVIRGTDRGIWRRPILIPFRATFSNDPVPRGQSEATFRSIDPHIGAKLSREMPGILNWAVEGAVAWRAMGLSDCAVTREATDEYRRECDVVGLFLEQCCEQELGAFTPSQKLYDRYVEWATRNGEYVQSNKRLTRTLVERQIKHERRPEARGFLDLALKPQD